MKNLIFTLISISLFTTSAFAFKAVPKGSSFEPVTIQGGLSTSPKCDGSSDEEDSLKVSFEPSCYAVNIRNARGLLNPNGAPIQMRLNLTKGAGATGPTNTQLLFKIPTKVAWPEFYGYRCQYVGTDVTCNILDERDNTKKDVKYTDCQIGQLNSKGKASKFFKGCKRESDVVGHGGLNKVISCSMIWSGNTANSKWVSCRIKSLKSKLGSQVDVYVNKGTVNNSFFSLSEIPADFVKQESADIYAKQGFMSVGFSEVPYPKPQYIVDNRTKEILSTGGETKFTAQFYQGTTRLSSRNLRVNFVKGSNDQCVSVKVMFPGVKGFCGSYKSPLMLFFDKKIPKFLGSSNFPLQEKSGLIGWPEKNSSGYFLAYNSDGTKTVRSGKQLFGDNNSMNGFDALKRYDENSDNKIDKNDRIFSKLFLWQDKNGNGVSEKTEVVTLEKLGITSINLKYNNDQRLFKARGRAELRQSSTFTFKQKGKVKTGEVYDVWFKELGK